MLFARVGVQQHQVGPALELRQLHRVLVKLVEHHDRVELEQRLLRLAQLRSPERPGRLPEGVGPRQAAHQEVVIRSRAPRDHLRRLAFGVAVEVHSGARQDGAHDLLGRRGPAPGSPLVERVRDDPVHRLAHDDAIGRRPGAHLAVEPALYRHEARGHLRALGAALGVARPDAHLLEPVAVAHRGTVVAALQGVHRLGVRAGHLADARAARLVQVQEGKRAVTARAGRRRREADAPASGGAVVVEPLAGEPVDDFGMRIVVVPSDDEGA
mmetsp:Transcript_95627/g.270681  ORF Transcript_95627/g.270681 Transcript_95627/m.270681 type:complete len:269 (-) Transcript_95627:223-1029(-)